jgi:Flp pilus assembly protein TadG
VRRSAGWLRARVGRAWHSERGAVLVEFGLVAPVMALMTCAIIDFSMAMFTLNNLTLAVREGGRRAAVLSNLVANDPRVVTRVDSAIIMQFKNRPPGYTVTVTRVPATGTVIENVTVQINNYSYRPITPMASLFGMSAIPMNRQAVFRSELSND